MSSSSNVRVAGLFFVIAAFVAGCGNVPSHVPVQTGPSGLSYSQASISAVVNQAITPDAPTVTGTVDSYTVSPSLPAGLTLDSSTGMISGTPTAAAAEGSYAVTGSNAAGSTSATVQIAVAAQVIAPSGLVYPQASISATVGQTIASDTPTVTGTATSYTVSPVLPAGLTVSSTKGTISGTPTAVAALASYTVTASNSAGTTTATLQLAVAPQAAEPSGLTYPQGYIDAKLNVAIAPDTPTVTGPVASYTVSPALPAGLAISSTTGTVSGTPTAASAEAPYVVTASNSAGSSTTTLYITVAPLVSAPSGFYYSPGGINCVLNVAISPEAPTVTGPVTSYSVSPALPAGLTLNNSSGTISGTPTAVSPQTLYAVTASNSAGSATTQLQITVAASEPPTPTVVQYVYPSLGGFVGEPFQQDTVSGVWAIPTAFTISPALPAGLAINSTDGEIFGTPTAAAPTTAYTVTSTNSNGVAIGTVQLWVNPEQAPGGVYYQQATVDAYVGEPIADVGQQAYGGPVDSISVTPPLPAGLNLSRSTGTIAGTPTTVSPSTTYTITESNAAGSTPVTVQITVGALRAPTALVYPQTSIATYVGRTITPDIPGWSGGPMTSFSVTPALPAGLSMDPSTGVISGTPTAVSAQTNYIVTGANSAGSISSANTSITVTEPPIILMALGNSGFPLLFANGNIFSGGGGGPWTLWNYESGAILASGDAGLGHFSVNGGYYPPASQMAGPTLAVGIPGGIEVLSSGDGHALGTIVSPGYTYGPFQLDPSAPVTNSLQRSDEWQLASDGSYISIETQAGLYVYAPNGQLLFSEPGDYTQDEDPWYTGEIRSIFAAPGQVLVAGGPAAANAIETITVPSGISTLASPFQGQFVEWFGDGSHFVSQSGYSWHGQPVFPTPPNAAYYVYTNTSVQQWATQLAPTGGWGNWIWVEGGGFPYVAIYAIGNTTPALTYSNWDFGGMVNSGPTLAFLPQDQALAIVDLSGSTPVETDYTLPQAINQNAWDPFSYPAGVYAAESASEWVLGFFFNGILDGPSTVTSTPRYIGSGAVNSIGGSSDRVAVSIGNGEVTWFDPSNPTAQGSTNSGGGEVELSTDGTVMAAASTDGTTVNLYSLPADTVTNTLSNLNPNGQTFSFTLSGSGTTLGAVSGYGDKNGSTYTVQVASVSTGQDILSMTASYFAAPVAVSPDGTLVAVCCDASYTNTLIYQNGTQVAAVPGQGIGWLDNGRLLAVVGQRAAIYTPSGTVLATPSLPYEFQAFQTVTPDTIYFPSLNAIYSLTTGQPTWTSPYHADGDFKTWGPGAVAGQYVVFESEGNVIAVPY